ncbi:hypothetical protein LIER_31249 [Lithospermum erythrorhizon]|uniref:Reverse transcriptase Ty1/copia-type domain-containing protein n=1 Tax=Lithospermum erythrorhizon TaxID=34254 RepID=A0AAV3RUC7_LITER
MLDRLYVKQISRPIKEEGIRPAGSLPDSWETLSVSLSASAVDRTLTKEIISNAILNEDNKRRSNNKSKNNLNFDALVFEKKKWVKKKGKLNQENAKNKKEDQCHYYDKIGHWKSDCYTFKRDVANGTVKNKKTDNNVAMVDQDSDLIVVDNEVCYASSDDDWVIDSGASFHSKLGKVIVLSNVRHIPDFRLSLISSGKLDDEGYINTFGNGQWKLSRGDIVIAQGKKSRALYRASFNICKDDDLNEWPRMTIQENADTNLLGDQEDNEIDTEINLDIQQPADVKDGELDFQDGANTSMNTQSVRTSSRNGVPSTRYPANEYILLSDGGKSLYYHEAMEREDKNKWIQAMQEEMTSLYKNNTYSLGKRVPGKKVLKNKWVYKLKFEERKTEHRYKARLVVKGFEQKYEVDYDEIFSPVEVLYHGSPGFRNMLHYQPQKQNT